MSTPNQFSNTDFSTNLVLNALSKDDKSAKVYDLSGGYNVIDLLATRNRPARKVVGQDGKFSKPIMGRSQILQQVASTSIVGSQLRVNWVDPTFDLFRNTFTLTDGTAANNLGNVVAHAPGYVLLDPGPTITSWNTAIHFVPGSYALELFNSSVNRGSDGVESLYEYPAFVQNQTAVCRENVQLFRRDMSQTWVEFKGEFWYSAQDMLMVQRYARAMDFSALWNKFDTKTSSLGGVVNYSMGIKQAIQDPIRGGVYLGLSNAMTQQQFEDWIGQIADRQAADNVELNLLMGRGALNQIQKFTQPYIQFGGNTNTFGGATVRGLDVRQYSVNGIHCNFIMLPVLNDREKFPQISTIPGLGNYTRMSYTIICLDLNNYEAKDGGSLPSLEKCYFGGDEMVYYYTPGVIGTNTKGSDMFTSGNPFLAANSKDGVTWGVYSDICYDYMAYRSGWLELVV
jgi:hypothetical protein